MVYLTPFALFLCRSIYELWGEGENLEELHAEVKKTSDRWVNSYACFQTVICTLRIHISYLYLYLYL